MKYHYKFLAALLALVLFGACAISTLSAQPAQVATQLAIPNLTGTWNTESVGSVMFKSSLPGEWTHHKDRYSRLTAQAVVTDQQGRILHGMFAAPVGKNESFIAIIGMDNASVYLVDHDGFMDLKIINDDLMTGVYHHITENDSVVAESTWTRAK